ncbi:MULTISPECIES: DUF957 domain-containing protein [Enterobacteriaceae]|nr:Enterobacterial protein of uncharacterised function (DUF957) [Citrobacter koseri]STT20217.1 Enterobacterial protein of uncharacterised function (DUF957) [Citrobacter koseri]
MSELTTETALQILSDWLQNNIDCGTMLICDFCNKPERISHRTVLVTRV